CPLRPMDEVGTIDQFTTPARIDINTSDLMAGGPNTAYQNQRRYKPQFNASLSYFKDGWHGSHNFKFGSEGRREKRKFLADQPFDIAYYDARLGVTPVAPRAGLACDVGGEGKAVVKGVFGRFYFNSSPDALAAQANPVGRTRLRYRWTDTNENLVIDSPAELGTFLRTIGSASTT